MKSIFQSKVVWFNVLTIGVAVATFFGYTPNQELFGQVTNILIISSPVVNLILRYFTNKGVAILPQ